MLQRAGKQGRKYVNPVPTSVGDLRLMLKLLPLYISNREETEPRQPLPHFRTDAEVYRTGSASGLRVTWFGHSSTLVEIDGFRVLIDPVWDQRAAPLTWMGPKRFFPPTLKLEELPRAEVVLISHDHYDHLGRRTVEALAKLWRGVRWVCPLGVGRELAGFGVAAERIQELDWTEETVVDAPDGRGSLRITALPARHFSGRSLSNRFETLWASFVLTGPGHRVYYGADSGLWEGMAEIGAHFGPFDLTMLEIGAFNELWKDIHLGPEGAIEAFQRFGGGLLMPIHWGLFNLALHAWTQPIARVTALAQERGVRMFCPVPGVPTEVTEMRADWWAQGNRA